MKRTALKRKRGLARKPWRRKAPKRPPADPRAALERLDWWRQVTDSGRAACAVCGSHGTSDDPTEGHHVIEKQTLKRLAPGRVWDVDGGLPLCPPCHSRHTLAFRRVPRHKLRPRNLRFVRELGFDHLLDRYYPVESA